MRPRWHSSTPVRPSSHLLRAALMSLCLATGSCIYAPKLLDCKVRCGEDNLCPTGTTCDNGFCRPDDADGFCACSPGEERACGGGVGECLPGVQRCGDSTLWGVCLGEVKPTVETCDGKDNNCNGQVDDQVSDAPPCGRSKGVCAGKMQQCINGSYPGSCMDSEYGPDFEPIETRCDTKDNDCDGFVDAKPPRHLVDSSDSYALVGLDGGYALAWSATAGNGLTQVHLRFFDNALQPLAPQQLLGQADAGLTVRGVGTGDRAYFAWEKDNLDVRAAYVDRSAPTVVNPLPALPRPDAVGGLRFGGNGDRLVAAWPIDAGVGILEWPSDGGSYQLRYFTPLTPMTYEVSYLNVSSQGNHISYEVDFYTDDAGSTDSDYILMRTDGTQYHVGPYVGPDNAFMDTRGGKAQSAYSGYCNYSFFGFTCVKSYLYANFDLMALSSSNIEVRTNSDPNAIYGGHAATAPADWVLAWIENTSIRIASPVTQARTIRFAPVDIDGGIATTLRIANSGSDFNAIVYQSSLVTGSLEGVLSCAP